MEDTDLMKINRQKNIPTLNTPTQCRITSCYMYLIILLGLFFSVSVFATEVGEEFICGIPISETNGVDGHWLGYQELQDEEQISENEALIAEFSNDSYCKTEEYAEKFENFFEKEMSRIGESTNIFREGFQDQCQYLAIISAGNSPFKFHSKFNRRVHTEMVDGELTTWLVYQNQGAIKLPLNGNYQCVKNDI